jgi:hypothetical protein
MKLSRSIVRRRKEHTGEPLVERTCCPVRVPFGQREREPGEKWLKGFERFFCETTPTRRSSRGRGAPVRGRARPALQKLEYAAALPGADPELDWTAITASNWTPKTLNLLELCLQLVGTGDEVLVGSCLIDRPHPRRAAAGARRARRTHRRGARRPRPRPRTRANARPRCTSSWRATPTCSAPDATARREGRQLGGLMAHAGPAPRPSSTRM